MFALKQHFNFSSQRLLAWFSLRQRDDFIPRSEDEVVTWLDALPAHHAFDALSSIVSMLESLANAQDLPIANRCRVLHALDNAATPHVSKIYADYLALLRGQAQQEARLWLALNNYWLGVEHACAKLVAALPAHDQIRDETRAALLVRALAALNQQAKLARMRYCAVDARIWGEIGRIFSLVEAQPAGEPSAVMRIGAHIFMREMASPQNLLPQEIEIVDVLAHRYAALFMCQRQASTETGYHFDLSSDQAPSRRLPAGPLSASSCFFGAGESYRQAELDADSIERQGSLEAFPDLARFTPNEVGRLLRHVAQLWSPTPPVREHVRSVALSRALIVFDLNEICRNVATGDSLAVAKEAGAHERVEQADFKQYGFVTERTRQQLADMPDALLPNASELTENWVVRDESSGGIGAEVPSHAADWLCAGKLIGFKREGGGHWGVGVIRRLELDARAFARVGIQVLSEQPRLVRLRPLSAAQLALWDRHGEAPSYEYFNGILLSLPRGREVGALLLPNGTYHQEQNFEWAHDAISELMVVTKVAMHTEAFDVLLIRLA